MGAEAKPQNNQGNNIQWNEERRPLPMPQPMPQPIMAKCSLNSRGERTCTTPRTQRPRQCTNGHLHVMTGPGYNQNQRFDHESEPFGLNVIAATAHSDYHWGGGCCWDICGGNHGWCYRIYPNQFRYIYVRNVSNIRI